MAERQPMTKLPGMSTQEGGSPFGPVETMSEEGAAPSVSNKTLYIIGGVIVAAGVGYYLYSKKPHVPNRRRR
jgi:hypothetical protein